MNVVRRKQIVLFLLLIILSVSLFSQVAFAESNATCEDLSQHDTTEVVVNSESGDSNDIVQNSKNTTLFIVSDNPGTNVLDKASQELFAEHDMKGVNLVIRNGNQVKTMSEDELAFLLNNSDAFIGEWISSDVDSVLTSLLGKYPEMSNKEIFLILEAPSGNLNSDSSSIKLLRNNTVNYNKIFAGFTNDELIKYFKNTKRGLAYSSVND